MKREMNGMSSIGGNIRTVRQGLGLSQEAFAELVGVSFSSQRRYERGDSSPDTAYLESLKHHGIDADFILRGRGATPKEFDFAKEIYALRAVITEIGERLGCNPDVIRQALDDQWAEPSANKSWGRAADSVIEVFFAGCSLEVDSSLLALVIEGVEVAISKWDMRISPIKKAQAITMLYRAFKPSGKVDHGMIEETVKLASS
jgi:transcriptional regulator with XRE-family HTH domain